MDRVHELSRADARRVAVRAQLLDAARPTDLLAVARRLMVVQLDPISAVAPSADLVFWGRLGEAYAPRDRLDAVEAQELIELRGLLRPAEDIALFRADMDAWPGEEPPGWRRAAADWVAANDGCRRDILERLRGDGPLPMSELPDLCDVPWRSSGWNNNKNVTMLLGLMVERGEVAVAGGSGRDRLWDLAERIYPDVPVLPAAHASRMRDARRLASLGIARTLAPATPHEPNDVAQAGEPAVVDGVKGRWRVDPAYLDGPFEGRAALLSPFDRLVYDRKRTAELFEFGYTLEMYKPAAKRRWGYYALPILCGDRLVGKLDARTEDDAGVFRVRAVHEDAPFDTVTREAVDAEIEALAHWLELDLAR